MDRKLFLAINRLSGHIAIIDRMMIFMSNKARYIFVFTVIFMFFKNQNQKKGAINATIASGICLLISFLANLFSFKPRPFMKQRVGILIPSKHNSSFPSKHTLLVFAVATSIMIRNRLVGVYLLILASLTGVSRIWVGHHYPSDVIWSALIGSTTSFLTERREMLFTYFDKLKKMFAT